MSLDVVASPLTSFSSSQEFVGAIVDTMEAHQHAYFDAQLLHCNIGAGNILITGHDKGFLINWDLCVNISKTNNENTQSFARRPDRMGTWQFMSAALLQDNDKCNELVDERESSLHILTWTALHFTDHIILLMRVVVRNRNLRESIGGESEKVKKSFGMAVLEGLESYIRNQLHIKQYINHVLNSFKSHSHSDPNTHTLTPGNTNQLLGEDTVYTPASKPNEQGSKHGDDSLPHIYNELALLHQQQLFAFPSLPPAAVDFNRLWGNSVSSMGMDCSMQIFWNGTTAGTSSSFNVGITTPATSHLTLAEALVQCAQRSILDMDGIFPDDEPPKSSGQSPLSAKLAAYGKASALKRRLKLVEKEKVEGRRQRF
ncbi:hypothetical protein PILCRDRAFT_15307 [Piloderma croceum F 1598]|uniref:Fungal-type protein kinase domain-containing protein n=1 Tax=Piloderma croceum (strain F 1598) TaxID=765440 RepID=A0A0C3AHP0_PILCF|nr:hypothetical protein PILCRDRAFT_15307 [Piloderma croceum F 1598]